MNQLKDHDTYTNQETLSSVVGKAAYAIANTLSPGEVAQLRRTPPDQPYSPAFWRLLIDCIPQHWVSGVEQEEKEVLWAALFTGLSHAAGLHNPQQSLGKGLAESGWSELRFVRLLRDRDKLLIEHVRRVARYLASKDQPCNWCDMANLLMNQQGEWAERHRRRIARDYYRAVYEQNRSEDK